MSGVFIYLLFSQPLIIRKEKVIKNDQYGNITNGKTIWDFSEKKSNLLPESIFLDINNKSLNLKSLKNKTLYISFWATWCGPCRKEKPALEKLKKHFKNKTDIVFIDISVDGNKEKWKKFIESNKPSGTQLISKNDGKTRELFELPGIPAHIVVNSKGEFVKARVIQRAYKLLSDSIYLDKFINREFPITVNKNKMNIEDYRATKYVKLDSTKTTYYTINGKSRLLAPQINAYLDSLRIIKKVSFVNLLIEKKPIPNKDTIIYKTLVVTSKTELTLTKE